MTIEGTNLADVLEQIRQMKADLSTPNLDPSVRVRIRDTLSKFCSIRDRIEKREELLEDRIVTSHPMFRRVLDGVVEALAPFPDAARAVSDRLAAAGVG